VNYGRGGEEGKEGYGDRELIHVKVSRHKMIGEFTNVDNHHSLMKGRGRGGGEGGGRTRQPTPTTTRLSVRRALMSSLSTKAERRQIAKGERKG